MKEGKPVDECFPWRFRRTIMSITEGHHPGYRGTGTKLTLGKFGDFGGRFVPESMILYLEELALGFESAIQDPSFWREYIRETQPTTQLHKAHQLTAIAQGATIWLKREDQNRYGSHRTRSIVGHLLLARRMGRSDIVTDCAAAKHGKFTAEMCVRFGMRCTVIMGEDDHNAQLDDVKKMKLLGATVIKVRNPAGLGTWRAATTEALQYAVSHYDASYCLMGSASGPHPLPAITGTFQSLLGEEVKTQMNDLTGGPPDAVVTCIGSGSAAVGLFRPFLSKSEIRLVGVEADQAAVLTRGETGVLQGTKTYCLQDKHGQILDSRSISPDMNISCVGPELAHWRSSHRVEVSMVTDAEAKVGLSDLSRHEKILSGADTGYAVKKVVALATDMGPGRNIVLLVTGPDNITPPSL